MKFLASCTVEESKEYKGNLVIKENDKKSHTVMLNIIARGEHVYSDLSGNEKCVTFVDNYVPSYVPDKWKGNVFTEFTKDEYLSCRDGLPVGLVPLIRVDSNYSDMREVSSVCKEHSDVRYIGGNFLLLDGVRIGRYDGKKPIVCNGVYDDFTEVKLSDLNNISEVVKSTKVKKEKEGSLKKKKAKSSKYGDSFGSLFGESEISF